MKNQGKDKSGHPDSNTENWVFLKTMSLVNIHLHKKLI
jgi:hypothetical protein